MLDRKFRKQSAALHGQENVSTRGLSILVGGKNANGFRRFSPRPSQRRSCTQMRFRWGLASTLSMPKWLELLLFLFSYHAMHAAHSARAAVDDRVSHQSAPEHGAGDVVVDFFQIPNL